MCWVVAGIVFWGCTVTLPHIANVTFIVAGLESFLLWMMPLMASAYPELFAVVGAKVPDYRGLFLRGVGRNSEALGILQTDAFQGHRHDHYGTFTDYGPDNWEGTDGNRNTGNQYNNNAGVTDAGYGTPRISHETRPVNKAVRYLIKAL